MYKVEKYWRCSDLKCVVLQTDIGHRCGYVGVPERHPLYKHPYNKHSDKLKDRIEPIKNSPIGKRGIIPVFTWGGEKASPEIVFNVHGGITFSRGGENTVYPIPTDDLTWWFGFDCAHAGDAKDLSVVSHGVRDIELKYPTHGEVRSLEYCVDECNSLAQQLASVE